MATTGKGKGSGASPDRDDAGAGDDVQRAEQYGTLPEDPRIGTALVAGNTFPVKAIQYVEVDGMAIVEGDIALGSVDAVDSATTAMREQAGTGVAFGVGITGDQFRWPNCRIPYEIDPSLPNQTRVTDAIAHWETNTSFRFVVRTTEANWVFFTDSGGCWSMVGMRGGRQTISLGSGCSTGNAIHEIGHTVGLWHEQSREDRDQFVTINWQNIQNGMASQFSQHIADGDDLGAYDYASIVHYPRTAFSKNGLETITPVDPSAQIGQRNGLSPGDIAAVRAMYPGCGGGVVKPVWREPLKPVRDPKVFKKVVDDERIIKVVRDPRKPPRDPGPIKLAGYDVPTIPGGAGPLVNPNPLGGLRPFAMATGHHADLGAEEQAQVAATSALEALQVQLLEVEAAMGRAQAAAAEAGLELGQLQAVRDALEAAYDEATGAG
jgi:hypothetical protein